MAKKQKLTKKEVEKLFSSIDVKKKTKHSRRVLQGLRLSITKNVDNIIKYCHKHELPFEVFYTEMLTLLRDIYILHTEQRLQVELDAFPDELKEKLGSIVVEMKKEIQKQKKEKEETEKKAKEPDLSYIG